MATQKGPNLICILSEYQKSIWYRALSSSLGFQFDIQSVLDSVSFFYAFTHFSFTMHYFYSRLSNYSDKFGPDNAVFGFHSAVNSLMLIPPFIYDLSFEYLQEIPLLFRFPLHIQSTFSFLFDHSKTVVLEEGDLELYIRHFSSFVESSLFQFQTSEYPELTAHYEIKRLKYCSNYFSTLFDCLPHYLVFRFDPNMSDVLDHDTTIGNQYGFAFFSNFISPNILSLFPTKICTADNQAESFFDCVEAFPEFFDLSSPIGLKLAHIHSCIYYIMYFYQLDDPVRILSTTHHFFHNVLFLLDQFRHKFSLKLRSAEHKCTSVRLSIPAFSLRFPDFSEFMTQFSNLPPIESFEEFPQLLSSSILVDSTPVCQPKDYHLCVEKSILLGYIHELQYAVEKLSNIEHEVKRYYDDSFRSTREHQALTHRIDSFLSSYAKHAGSSIDAIPPAPITRNSRKFMTEALSVLNNAGHLTFGDLNHRNLRLSNLPVLPTHIFSSPLDDWDTTITIYTLWNISPQLTAFRSSDVTKNVQRTSQLSRCKPVQFVSLYCNCFSKHAHSFDDLEIVLYRNILHVLSVYGLRRQFFQHFLRVLSFLVSISLDGTVLDKYSLYHHNPLSCDNPEHNPSNSILLWIMNQDCSLARQVCRNIQNLPAIKRCLESFVQEREQKLRVTFDSVTHTHTFP